MEEPRYNWKDIIISAILIFILPLVINLAITFSYGMIVGFQSRGDAAVIEETVGAFASSIPFLVLMLLVTGGIVFWRGRLLRDKVSAPLHNALIMAVIAKVIHSIVIVTQSTDLGFTLPWLVADWIISLVAAYFSATVGGAGQEA